MDGYSLTPKDERLKTLQQLIPEAFTEGKIDWEKLRAALGDDINFANERYVLNWAGKSDAFRIMQQPSSATLIPIREESVHFDSTKNIFIEGENMEVLKILQKSYFGKVKMIYIDPPYNTGSDSFIYPDRFAETQEEYLRRVGDKTEDGYMTREGLFRKNSRENGQYHSNWLNMMMPRLYLAKSLLRDDGVIFISIDDNEVANLRLICDEIFGNENFVAQLVWEKKKKGAFLSESSTNVKEYVLAYAKNSFSFKGLIGEIARNEETYPVIKTTNSRGTRKIKKGIPSKYKEKDYFLPKGSRISAGNMEMILLSDLVIRKGQLDKDIVVESNWIYSQELIDKYALEKSLYITQDLYFRRIVSEPREKKLKDLLPMRGEQSTGFEFFLSDDLFSDGWGTNEDGFDELHDLFEAQNIMSFPKPSKFLAKLVLSACRFDRDCIVLDFFAGSSTTAHAVMQLNAEDNGNRQFIMIQLTEPCEKKSEAFKAGYKTIAEIGKERIRRAGLKIRKELKAEQAKQKVRLEKNDDIHIKMPDLGFKVFRLADSNFKQWRPVAGSNSESWKQQMIDFINPVMPNATSENMEYELLLKNGKDLNCQIEHKNGYSLINGNEMALILESVTSDIIKNLLAEKPMKVIALDNLFEGNDQLKTNMALQMRDAGIQFRTI